MNNSVATVWAIPRSAERVTWDGDVDWFDEWVRDLVDKADESNPFAVDHNSDGSVSVTNWEVTRTLFPGQTLLRFGDDIQPLPDRESASNWSPYLADWDIDSETWRS